MFHRLPKSQPIKIEFDDLTYTVAASRRRGQITKGTDRGAIPESRFYSHESSSENLRAAPRDGLVQNRNCFCLDEVMLGRMIM